MLKDHKRWPFTEGMLQYAPDDPGVYILWDGDEAIYIGRALGKESVKTCLLAHRAGSRGECSSKATHYSWAISVWPASMETELFAEFHRQYKRDPRCHDKAA
jgi:hypothetical protein